MVWDINNKVICCTKLGRKKILSAFLRSLAGSENSTDRDRLSGEKHKHLFHGNFMWHRRLHKEMKTQRDRPVYFMLGFLFFKFWLFIFLAMLGLHCCAGAFSSCSEWGLLSSCGPQALITVASLVAEQLQFTGSRAQAQLLRCTGLVALRQVGPSLTKDKTGVLCIMRWILNYWTTKEAPFMLGLMDSVGILWKYGKLRSMSYL